MKKLTSIDLKDFQFVFIELPKFPKSKEKQLESIVDRWLFFFKYAEETTDEDLRRIAEKAPIIKLAYNELDRFSWNEKDLIAYEERIMDPHRKKKPSLNTDLILLKRKASKSAENLAKRKAFKLMRREEN